MRIVIIGGGQVGSALARALALEHEVVVVDQAPEAADVFQAMEVQFLLGSGTSADVLQQAEVAGRTFSSPRRRSTKSTSWPAPWPTDSAIRRPSASCRARSSSTTAR